MGTVGNENGAEAAQIRATSGFDLLDRYATLRNNIAKAALSCGRDPQSVTLVAASKTQPEETIQILLDAGHMTFGENRVQEARAKWPGMRAGRTGVELRLIGPLQSNKARDAVELFDVIETLDRTSLAVALAKEVQRIGRQPRLYVEVNTGAEQQKAGLIPSEVDAFLDACRRDYGLSVTGLMCVPPLGEPASPHFALLYKIASRNGLPDLSMGMSADYPLAIQLGATHVRVGSALFGSRVDQAISVHDEDGAG